MTASTYLVRSGMSATVTADYELHLAERSPDRYAHVERHGWHVDWRVTAGESGRELASGRTRTRWGADGKARAAAHRPGAGKAASR